MIPDAGRGKYSKDYFRQARYANIFANSYGHNVPRIGGQLQSPGPEFGGHRQFHGTLVDYGTRDGQKFALVDFAAAYAVDGLRQARRRLTLDAATGAVALEDDFAFDGAPLAIEEAFVSWFPIEAEDNAARIQGEHHTLRLEVVEPAGATLTVERLEEACRENAMQETLSRLAIALPEGTTRCRITLTPQPR